MDATSGCNSSSSLDHPSTEVSINSSSDEGPHQSYWERLPPEIFADIFLMCRPLKKDLPPSKVHAPHLLTYVCRAWYKIVTDIPRMWSTVVLTTASISDTIPPSRLQAGARHLGLCTIRSKAAPVELYIRAEFIAHPASFERVQCAELRHLILVYPFAPLGPLPPFFPLPLWMIMPNLTTLEVHSQCTISSSDLAILNGIMDSARTLKRHVFLRPASTKILGQPIIQNMSNLEILTLHELIPISACPLILQNAPLLRKLSLAVGIPSDDELVIQGMELPHTSTTWGIAQPFTHPRLRYLALAHFRCDLSTLFECITLPLLQFLVIDFRARGSTTRALWPHHSFVTFLRRSGCKLKSFHILDQPITPSQLLELLRLPHLADLLEYLGIQHYAGEERAIDDYLLGQLTLPSSTLQEEAAPTPTSGFEMARTREPSSILCPNIERFLLFVPLEGFTLPNLVTMFNSRLPLNTNSVLPHKPLRQVEIDLYDGMKEDLKPLREKGLVLTLFEPLESDPMPLDAEQQRLWGRYLAEGLDDEVYDHVMGTWRASDMTLALP